MWCGSCKLPRPHLGGYWLLDSITIYSAPSQATPPTDNLRSNPAPAAGPDEWLPSDTRWRLQGLKSVLGHGSAKLPATIKPSVWPTELEPRHTREILNREVWQQEKRKPHTSKLLDILNSVRKRNLSEGKLQTNRQSTEDTPLTSELHVDMLRQETQWYTKLLGKHCNLAPGLKTEMITGNAIYLRLWRKSWTLMMSIKHNNFWRHLITCTVLCTIYENGEFWFHVFKRLTHSPSYLTSKLMYAL